MTDNQLRSTAANQPTVRVVNRPTWLRSPIGIMLTGLLVFGLVMLLFLAATGQLMRPFGRIVISEINRTLENGADLLGAGTGNNSGTSPTSPAPGSTTPVAARFQNYYNSRNGSRLLGLPISQPITEGGREVQWFERGRLEYHPEYLGTPYEVQPGLVGVQYTEGRVFAKQQFFASRADLRYFAETGHGVGGLFLEFWQQNGGLDTFGLPISDEFDETLDGRTRRVQYFERARLEYWPEFAGTPNQIQLGLLGKMLYAKDPRPTGNPPAPTQVPLP
jgi:hypothetical protein